MAKVKAAKRRRKEKLDERERLIRDFREVRVADIVDALYGLNLAGKMVMDPGIYPIRSGYDMRGFAFTVRYIPTREPFDFITPAANTRALRSKEGFQEKGKGAGYDPSGWLAKRMRMRKTLDEAQANDVIVYDNGGRPHYLWGSCINVQGIAMGLTGIVTDGATRDIYDLRQQELPIFTRLESSVHHGPEIELVEVNGPVVCGGIQVVPGDLICGDDDGVVVVPRHLTEPILNIARAVADADARKKAEWMGPVKKRYGRDWQKRLRAGTGRQD